MVDKENVVPTIKQYPLERVKILKKFIASEIGYLIWGIIFAGLTVLLSLAPIISGISTILIMSIVVLFLLITAINWWYQTKYYETYYYDIRQNFLVIKKGVFMPRETTLPFEKLQDVYVDQDIFDRIFNLWDLHVSTATIMSGMEAHIDGVNIGNANVMREILLGKIKETK
ncbi:MAG: PH domain-containing protein [Candidatus Diapherotrites archaeon]|nr:PH domain-containing protein [Candidatus Diapherotrites archaeon]